MTELATTVDPAGRAPQPEIDIDVTAPAWHDFLPKAEALARAAALAAWSGAEGAWPERLRHFPVEVSLRLADDGEVAALNGDYRGREGATNVLSFPGISAEELDGHPPGAPVLLGDIVLAQGVVAEEAERQGKSPADHFRHLVVHGMLHLLGYDHVEARDAEIMERLETTLLAGLGIADPYGAVGAGTDPRP
jgi:probable rRNA maturation factor